MTGQIKVSKAFITAFAYVANFYEWTPDVIDEVKEQTRGNNEMMRYWMELAYAHKNGYRQTKENNFMRLTEWQQRRSMLVQIEFAKEALDGKV